MGRNGPCLRGYAHLRYCLRRGTRNHLGNQFQLTAPDAKTITMTENCISVRGFGRAATQPLRRKYTFMIRSVLRRCSVFVLCSVAASSTIQAADHAQSAPARCIVVDLKQTTGPVDRFFDLSVGSDYPGTLIRDVSQAQLKVVSDELG